MSLTTQAARLTPRTRSVGGLAVLGGLALALGACSSGGARPPAAGQDAAVPLADSGAAVDAAMSSSDAGGTDGGGGDLAMVRPDLALPTDLGSPPSDLAAPADLAAAPDLAFPSAQGVAIYVSNTCVMDVVPKSIDVPRGATLKLTFNNRSRDYEVTVWMSYGGGYTDLATGGSWPDPIEHCRLPRPYNEYADISTACSSYRMLIHCL